MLEIVKAEGMYLYDAEGRAYMDLISGISVSNVGHRHPRVVEAVKQQLDRYMHLMVYGEYVQSPQTELAAALCGRLPEKLHSVYFLNSGAEVTEAALKLAKRHSGRSEIIACHKAYHGSTHAGLSLNSEELFRNPFRPLLPDIRFIHFNKQEDLEQITSRTAAVVVEPIQGEAGYIPADEEWLRALRKKCDETGSLLVFDEIQSGYGRCGSLFAFEGYGVIPDMLMLAKGMGGGMPIGALLSSAEIMSSFAKDPVLGHITTFGGHPVCCAAALACLHILAEGTLIGQVKEKESRFRSRLKHPAIHSISGTGLMLALEFDSYETNKKIIDRCIEKGLITDWFLFAPRKMRLSPPLIITGEQIDSACDIILSSIEDICDKD